MKKLTFIILLMMFSVSFGTSSEERLKETIESVIDLTEAELYKKFPEIKIPSRSFLNLVSKSLHPYHAPSTNKFLQLGSRYVIFELKCGVVIAIHKVSG